MAMAMRHGLNLEEGEGEVVELVDYVDAEGEDEADQFLLQQQGGTDHNLQQSRNSMLVEGSRRNSFLEDQA